MKIKTGDIATVINSIDGASVGITVVVGEYQGEHSKYGRIWRCKSKDTIVTEFGGFGNEADFAEDWLMKIDDLENLNDEVTELELHC